MIEKTIHKKINIIFFTLLIFTSNYSICNAASNSHLKIYSSQTKEQIIEKIKNENWAANILKQAHKSVDKYVMIHKKDSTWIISRLQMYWKKHYTQPYINGAHYSHSDGHAPEPTVRFTGGRDWATDWDTPSLENVKPYMDYQDDKMLKFRI